MSSSSGDPCIYRYQCECIVILLVRELFSNLFLPSNNPLPTVKYIHSNPPSPHLHSLAPAFALEAGSPSSRPYSWEIGLQEKSTCHVTREGRISENKEDIGTLLALPLEHSQTRRTVGTINLGLNLVLVLDPWRTCL